MSTTKTVAVSISHPIRRYEQLKFIDIRAYMSSLFFFSVLILSNAIKVCFSTLRTAFPFPSTLPHCFRFIDAFSPQTIRHSFPKSSKFIIELI